MSAATGPPGPGDCDGRGITPGHQHSTRHQNANPDGRNDTAHHRQSAVFGHQIAWYDEVFTWMRAWLEAVESWPVIGTPEWSALPDDDPAKWAAVLDAAQHWALRLETRQVAQCDASKAIAHGEDWAALSRRQTQRQGVYIHRRKQVSND